MTMESPHNAPIGAAPAAGGGDSGGASGSAAPMDPRTEILHAAAHCFMQRSFGATSIDDVARAMGATKGRVYHYWRSKLDLFVDVVRFSLELIYAKVAAAEGDGPPEVRMARMIRAHIASILEDRPFHRCAMQGVEMHRRGAATPEQREALLGVVALRDRHEKLFERVLAEGQETGVFAPGSPRLIARALMPAINGPVFWYRPRDGETEADREILIDEIAAFALRGLGAAPGRE